MMELDSESATLFSKPNYPLRRYSIRGLPKAVHYVPPTASTNDPLSQTKRPYLICPPGYEDAVVQSIASSASK
jgi:hypothetical protein